MIAAKFPTLRDEPDTVENFLAVVGLKTQLFEFAAEAVCEAVQRENANLDIADLVLGIRNNAAFRALAENGADYGVFQHRSRGGKACITNTDENLLIMVHNTDVATGMGAHAPKFMSKRSRRGTSYVHTEAQDEFDLGDEVIEFEQALDSKKQTTIDVCIFSEKTDGKAICRIELLVDAQMNVRANEFTGCMKRYGMKFKADDFVASGVSYDVDDEDFGDIIRPKHSNET